MLKYQAKFNIGQVVRHKSHNFRGVIYDVDPRYSNSDDWYESIPAATRPRKDQPFYHLFAVTEEGAYDAYVSEQNLQLDSTLTPINHPSLLSLFDQHQAGRYSLRKTNCQ